MRSDPDRAAKHVAVAMAYDDVIVVADLKTRAKRFQRVREEVLAEPDQLVYTTEYMHPRAEEVVPGLLPARLGAWIETLSKDRPDGGASIASSTKAGACRRARCAGSCTLYLVSGGLAPFSPRHAAVRPRARAS